LSTPTDEENNLILKNTFKFHPLTIEDTIIFNNHPKIDEYDDYLFIAFHSLFYHDEDNRIATWEIDFFVAKNFLVTTHLKPIPYVEEVKQELLIKDQLATKGIDFIVARVMGLMIKSYIPVLKKVAKKLDEVEKEVLSKAEDDTINDIYKIKRNLSLVRKILMPQLEVIEELMKYENSYFSEDSIMYYNEIINDLEQIKNTLNDYIEMSRDTLDAQLSISSYKMNIVMKRLTVIMTIVMPLTFLTGVGGMSEYTMMTGGEDKWVWSYLGFGFSCIIVGYLTYLYLKKNKWV